MNAESLILHLAVFAAALFQAATGIGFGLIAGPMLLIVLNDRSAVQVSILLSLLIAVVLTPSLIRSVDRVLLPRLLYGTIIGLPLGMAVFASVSVDWLKALAGLAVLFMSFFAVALGRPDGESPHHSGRLQDLAAGAMSGAMSAALAMPGPAVAARMMTRGQSKVAIRATLLVLFVFSYTAAIVVQAAAVGVAAPTLELCARLAPATLLGVLIGKISAGRISEKLFRRTITLILVATAASLLLSAAAGLLGLSR